MSKYSYEEKLEAVLRVIGTAQGHVQRWVSRYEKYGPDGLLLHIGKLISFIIL